MCRKTNSKYSLYNRMISSVHTSLPPLKKLKLNFILEIFSTTEFQSIACLSTSELRLCFRCHHQATGWAIKELCFDPRQGQKIFSTSKHFSGSGFLFIGYWRFLLRGHAPRYSAEVINRSSSPPISWRADGQICFILHLNK